MSPWRGRLLALRLIVMLLALRLSPRRRRTHPLALLALVAGRGAASPAAFARLAVRAHPHATTAPRTPLHARLAAQAAALADATLARLVPSAAGAVPATAAPCTAAGPTFAWIAPRETRFRIVPFRIRRADLPLDDVAPRDAPAWSDPPPAPRPAAPVHLTA